MKKTGIVIAAIACALLLCVGFYNLKNHSGTGEEAKDMTTVQKIDARNLEQDYPKTPRAVLKLYNEIITSYYEGNYTEEEFDTLTDTLKYLHNEYGLGACVTKEVHKLFHDNYGYKDFTAYDFLDFVYRVNNGEFDNWFDKNNIPINININYIEYLESTLSSLGQSA